MQLPVQEKAAVARDERPFGYIGDIFNSVLSESTKVTSISL